ncbi:30S ribosomal protein S2, partial [Staphylococcus epidermidis]|uniref:30S ribosomal protein S2 n=1 Tax=Staphylococcus epidermidis TaxID=1282 RepID=UPI001642904D
IKAIPQPLFLLHPPKHPNPIPQPPKLNIPILRVLDTNCHPHQIHYLIPPNHHPIPPLKLLTPKIPHPILQAQQPLSNQQVPPQQNINLDHKQQSQQPQTTQQN